MILEKLKGREVAYQIVRSDSQIDNVRNWAAEGRDQGTRFSGMSYEDGIEDMVAWLTGQTDENPTGEMV